MFDSIVWTIGGCILEPLIILENDRRAVFDFVVWTIGGCHLEPLINSELRKSNIVFVIVCLYVLFSVGVKNVPTYNDTI